MKIRRRLGVSLTPGFSKLTHAWLEQGGVWAEANIRGGGEFGERWHKDGYRTQKQHDYDD